MSQTGQDNPICLPCNPAGHESIRLQTYVQRRKEGQNKLHYLRYNNCSHNGDNFDNNDSQPFQNRRMIPEPIQCLKEQPTPYKVSFRVLRAITMNNLSFLVKTPIDIAIDDLFKIGKKALEEYLSCYFEQMADGNYMTHSICKKCGGKCLPGKVLNNPL